MATIETKTGPVNTEKSARRRLSYSSLSEVLTDLDALDASHRDGRLQAAGNWTPGQVCQHCAIFMRCAIDGFPGAAPAPLRWVATLLYKKKAVSGAPMPPGFRLPKQASFLLPADGVTWEAGSRELREVIGRVEAGERFTQPSPLLGRLTHDEWTRMQLSHCALHLSFLHPDTA